jgi:hypothetical protein
MVGGARSAIDSILSTKTTDDSAVVGVPTRSTVKAIDEWLEEDIVVIV